MGARPLTLGSCNELLRDVRGDNGGTGDFWRRRSFTVHVVWIVVEIKAVEICGALDMCFNVVLWPCLISPDCKLLDAGRRYKFCLTHPARGRGFLRGKAVAPCGMFLCFVCKARLMIECVLLVGVGAAVLARYAGVV